jgi:thiamine pyrophosphokinase
MSYHDMNKITKWLNSDINDYSKNEIIMLDCFLSITWTCMLRIEEATNITFHDIEWDLNHQSTPFTKIYISNRKTDIGKGLIFED